MPLEFAVQVVSIQTHGTEIYDEIFSVSDGRRVGVGRLRMTLHFRHAVEGDAFPQDRSRVLVDRVNLPGVLGIIFNGCDIAVESVLRFIFRATGYRSAHENLVAPNNWTRVGQARDLEFPTHVFGFRGVPFDGLCKTFVDAGRAGTAKLRPVLRLSNGESRR